MKINIARVLLGGLLAGVVLNIGEYIVNEVVLASEMKADFARFGLPQPGPDFIARAVISTFLLGIVIVYLYAVIRSHYGPGVKTAICAGLFAWFFVYLYTGVIYSGLGHDVDEGFLDRTRLGRRRVLGRSHCGSLALQRGVTSIRGASSPQCAAQESVRSQPRGASS